MLTSESRSMVATMSIFMVLSGLSVVLRILLRKKQRETALKVDDYFVIAAVFSAALAITNIVGVPVGGFGVPFELLSDVEVVNFLKILFVLQFWYIIAVALVKLSILCFYGRVFGLGQFPISVKLLLGVSIGWLISFLFATFFQVWPLSCNWLACYPTTNYPVMYVLSSVTDIVIDTSILCLPAFFIHRLRLSGNQKIGVGVIFGLGVFCVVSSVTRLAYTVLFYKVQANLDGNFALNFDKAIVNIIMWSGIEACASTICANLPCYGPLLGRARSIESIIASMRSLLRLERKSTHDPSVSNGNIIWLETSVQPHIEGGGHNTGTSSGDAELEVIKTHNPAPVESRCQ